MVIFLLAFAVSSAVINRWIVTDIGVLSIGRVWQLFIDWQDFGFVRRAFVGTVLQHIGVRSIFSNDYFYAIFVYHAAILFICGLLFFFVIKKRLYDPLFVMTVAFSPAMLFQLGYTTTSLDAFIVAFAALNMLFVRRVVLFCAIIVIGLLIHELFAFTIPAQMVALKMRLTDEGRWHRSTMLLTAVTTIAVSLFIVIYGKLDVPQDVFESIMAAKMPDAAWQMGLWSGYFEINSSFQENVDVSLRVLRSSLADSAIYLAVPIAYLVLLIARLKGGASTRREYLAVTGASLFPLCVTLIAYDHYRWIGLSCNLAILFTLIMVARMSEQVTRLDRMILPFALLGPLGSMPMDRPFPMLQFVLERLS